MNKEISRREALKIVGQIVAGGAFFSLSSGCAGEQTQTKASETITPAKSSSLTPSEKPTFQAQPTPTPEIKLTLSPEAIVFPQTQLTSEFVKQGFYGIGGEGEIDLGAMAAETTERKTFSWQTIEGYASLAWDEETSLEDLSQDEVKAAKALVSLGSQAGVEGFYRPGEVLPQFKDLTLLRLTINNLPGNQDFYDVKLKASPQELIIRKGTHLTVLGLWADASGRWATVAFDEGFDRTKEGIVPREVPRLYLAVVPQDLPEGVEGLSLERLLNANGYLYYQGAVEHLGDQDKLYRQELNVIESTFAKKLEEEAGALFMDQKPDGSWYENPIVPYPPQEQKSIHQVKSGETLSKIAQEYGLTLDELLKLNPQIKDPSKITVGQELTILIPGFTNYWGPTLTEDGRVVIFSQDQAQELAQAYYDENTRQWKWKKLVVVGPNPTLTPTEEATSEVTTPSEQFSEKRPSFLDEVGWREEVRTEIMGVPVSVDIVTGKTLQERGWFAIEKIVLNKEYYPDAEQRVGEIVMRAHWHAWVNDNPEERKNVSFEEYMTRLKNGEDLSYEAVVSAEYLTGTIQPKDPVSIDPRKPVELILTDRNGLIYLAEGVTVSFAQDTNGKLYVATESFVQDKNVFIEKYRQNPERILAYYTSYAITTFNCGLKVLSLSNEFQTAGSRAENGQRELRRTAACGYYEESKEMMDMDNLAYPCSKEGHEKMQFQALLKAILKEPLL